MKKIILTTIIALSSLFSLSAQEVGEFSVLPKANVYTNTGGGAIFGLGVAGRYAFSDNIRVEPALTALFKTGASIDVSADMHYIFDMTSEWKVYPLVGISANDIGSWSMGINFGVGTDYRIAERWDLTAGLKWMVQTAKWHKNPIIISFGGNYRF